MKRLLFIDNYARVQNHTQEILTLYVTDSHLVQTFSCKHMYTELAWHANTTKNL